MSDPVGEFRAVPGQAGAIQKHSRRGKEFANRIDERRNVLEGEVTKYVRQGYRVLSRSETTAQLVKPKSFSCLLFALGVLFLLVGALIYIGWYVSQHDRTIYLEVASDGRVLRTAGR